MIFKVSCEPARRLELVTDRTYTDYTHASTPTPGSQGTVLHEPRTQNRDIERCPGERQWGGRGGRPLTCGARRGRLRAGCEGRWALSPRPHPMGGTHLVPAGVTARVARAGAGPGLAPTARVPAEAPPRPPFRPLLRDVAGLWAHGAGRGVSLPHGAGAAASPHGLPSSSLPLAMRETSAGLGRKVRAMAPREITPGFISAASRAASRAGSRPGTGPSLCRCGRNQPPGAGGPSAADSWLSPGKEPRSLWQSKAGVTASRYRPLHGDAGEQRSEAVCPRLASRRRGLCPGRYS